MIVRVLLTGLAAVALAAGASLQAQSIYSYVDDRGVRVFTNLGSRSGGVATAVPAEIEEQVASGNYSGLVAEMASRYGLNADLVNAIIRVESAFDPLAVSNKNCMGLMQLHPDTARRFGVADVFDPRDNVEGGVKYLNWLIDEFEGEFDHVLAAYNAGEGAVRRYGGIPPYRETQDYVRKIRRLLGGPVSLLAQQPGRTPVRVQVIETDGSLLLTNLPAQSIGSR